MSFIKIFVDIFIIFTVYFFHNFVWLGKKLSDEMVRKKCSLLVMLKYPPNLKTLSENLISKQRNYFSFKCPTDS